MNVCVSVCVLWVQQEVSPFEDVVKQLFCRFIYKVVVWGSAYCSGDGQREGGGGREAWGSINDEEEEEDKEGRAEEKDRRKRKWRGAGQEGRSGLFPGLKPRITSWRKASNEIFY